MCPDIHGIFKISSPSWHWDVRKGCHGNFVISHVKLQISIGNSMICSDIRHKYHEWYFEIVVRKFHEPLGKWNLRQFWNITSGIYAKYHTQIMLLFVYTTTRKNFVIFTRRYFKLSWNTTAMSKSNCRNFSCSRITVFILLPEKFLQFDWLRAVVFHDQLNLKYLHVKITNLLRVVV